MTSLETRLIDFALADLATATEELEALPGGPDIEVCARSASVASRAGDLAAFPAEATQQAPAGVAEATAKTLCAERESVAGGEAYSIELWIPTLSCAVALAGPGVLWEAAVVGLESAVRLLDAMKRLIPGGRWDLPAIAGAIGASLAAVRLMALTPAQASGALSFAVVQAPLSSVSADSALRRLLIGQTAANTIEAMEAARRGLIAPGPVITGDRGLFRVLGAEPEDAENVTDRIGELWKSTPLIEHITSPGPGHFSIKQEAT